MRLKAILFTALIIASSTTMAEEPVLGNFAFRVIGRSSVTVTTGQLRLSDLAQVSSADLSQDEAVIGLQNIYISNSPAPGMTEAVPASMVIEQMKKSGVDLKKVGYSFPRIIEVKRAGRLLTLEEITQSITNLLKETGKDIAVKEVNVSGPIWIPPGDTVLKARSNGVAQGGRATYSILPFVDNKQQAEANVIARIEEWSQVPIANRPMRKGEIIQDGDLSKARLNVAQLPRDAVRSEDQLIGYETKREISFGEVFRLDKISVPPVITAGSKVSMLYKGGLFEVSGSAIALESGVVGQVIRVRNDSSKRVVAGTVVESGLVEVKP